MCCLVLDLDLLHALDDPGLMKINVPQDPYSMAFYATLVEEAGLHIVPVLAVPEDNRVALATQMSVMVVGLERHRESFFPSSILSYFSGPKRSNHWAHFHERIASFASESFASFGPPRLAGEIWSAIVERRQRRRRTDSRWTLDLPKKPGQQRDWRPTMVLALEMSFHAIDHQLGWMIDSRITYTSDH